MWHPAPPTDSIAFASSNRKQTERKPHLFAPALSVAGLEAREACNASTQLLPLEVRSNAGQQSRDRVMLDTTIPRH